MMVALTGVAGERPNVLLIIVDDLNDWVGCLGGHPNAKTPHIDGLAARGTLFANAHCQAPLCGPSRASFLSGLYPSSNGVYGQPTKQLGKDRERLRALAAATLCSEWVSYFWRGENHSWDPLGGCRGRGGADRKFWAQTKSGLQWGAGTFSLPTG